VVRARLLGGEPPVLDPQLRGGPLPGYAAALAALSDAELHRLLARRPDLLNPPGPASFPELAGRAGTPASLAAALRSLDLGTLRLAELLAVLGPPTTVEKLAAAAGPGLSRGRLEAGLAVLAELGVALTGPDGTISGPPGLAAPFGRPGGLGPPVAELAKVGVSAERLERILGNLGAPRPAGTGKAALVRAVSAALSDPEVVARAAADADQDARRLLDEALASAGPITVMGVGYGRFAGYADAEPASWLLERGLLLPVTYSQLVVPREAALGLRGGLVFPDWPQPPSTATPTPPEATAAGPAVTRTAPGASPSSGPPAAIADAGERAAAAATRAVVAAEGVCARLDREPLGLVRAGTVPVRDLARLARDLDLPEQELALLIDLLVEGGILAVGGPFGQRSLGLRPEADPWLAAPRAHRWATLAAAWRSADLAVEDHLATPEGSGRRGPGNPEGVPRTGRADPRRGAPVGRDRPQPLTARRLGAAPARRHALVQVLTDPASPEAVGALAPILAWRQPMVWPDPTGSGPDDLEATVRATLDAAGFLGIAVVDNGSAQPGLAAKEWLAGEGADGLAGAAGEAIPDGPDRFLLAGDLTVVAPGGLAPGVETRLAGLADREAAGSGIWRISDASLRRAFDEGRTAAEVLGFLRRHSSTPLPQALEYLAADVERRHGRLRVGGATTYLRGDPAAVTGAVRSAAGRRLGLRELAPGVAVTGRGQRELLEALRKAGESPLAEEPDGSPRPEGARPVRHVPRGTPDRLGRPPAAGNGHAADQRPELDPAAAVARLRGRRPADPGSPDADLRPRGDPDPRPTDDRRVARG
jgi:Helicase conserved C-terminal domain